MSEVDMSKIGTTKMEKKIIIGEDQLNQETMASSSDKNRNESCLHNFLSTVNFNERVVAKLEEGQVILNNKKLKHISYTFDQEQQDNAWVQ